MICLSINNAFIRKLFFETLLSVLYNGYNVNIKMMINIPGYKSANRILTSVFFRTSSIPFMGLQPLPHPLMLCLVAGFSIPHKILKPGFIPDISEKRIIFEHRQIIGREKWLS
jgi:hypothetical protein